MIFFSIFILVKYIRKCPKNNKKINLSTIYEALKIKIPKHQRVSWKLNLNKLNFISIRDGDNFLRESKLFGSRRLSENWYGVLYKKTRYWWWYFKENILEYQYANFRNTFSSNVQISFSIQQNFNIGCIRYQI